MAKFVTLVEIDFDSGTRYYSFEGVSAPARHYTNRLLSLSPIRREIGHVTREYTVADVLIQLDNSTREFSTLKAAEPFRNRIVRILFGDISGGLAALTRVFTGKIAFLDFHGGACALSLRDISFERLDERIEDRAVDDLFPNRPRNTPLALQPMAYGRLSSYITGSADGMVPGYLMTSADPYRYLVSGISNNAASPIDELIEHVYVYGALQAKSAYTVNVITVRKLPLENYVLNPGFEKGSDNWETDANQVVVTSNTNSRTGNRHFEVTATTGMPSGINDATQLDNAGNALLIPVTPLFLVRFRAYGFRVSGDGTGHVFAQWYDANRVLDTSVLVGTVNSAAWTELSIQQRVPEGVAFVQFGFRVDAGAVDTVVRFDDCEMFAERDIAVVDFTTDQRDSNRPDELEVWTDTLGFYNSIVGASRSVVTNPAVALQHYLENFVEVNADDIDQTAFDAVAAKCDELGLEIAGAITDKTKTHLENITEIATSFNFLFFVNRSGQYSISLPLLSDVGDPASLTSYSDSEHILARSFFVRSFNEIANRLQYNFQWNELKQFFESQPDVVDRNQVEIVGEDLRRNVNFVFVHNGTTALAVATNMLRCFRENVEIIDFALPISEFQLELNDIVRITHFQGTGASGYVDAIFRVIAIGLDSNPSTMKLEVRAVRMTELTGSNVWLQYMRLGDRTTLANTWGAASAADRQYAYLGDDTETAGDAKGTLGTSDPIKVLF